MAETTITARDVVDTFVQVDSALVRIREVLHMRNEFTSAGLDMKPKRRFGDEYLLELVSQALNEVGY